jgi:hypothetical protein
MYTLFHMHMVGARLFVDAAIYHCFCVGQRSRCTAGLYLAQLCVKSCAPPLPPPAQATLSLVHQQPSKLKDLDGADQEDSTVA